MKKPILFFTLVLSLNVANAQWQQTNGPLGYHVVTCFATQGKNIFAGNSWGVFLSVDNGLHWREVNNGLGKRQINSLVTQGTNIFAGTPEGVFLSADSGSYWTEVNNGLTGTLIYSLAVSGTRIFAGFGSGVCMSTDNGTSWSEIFRIPGSEGISIPIRSLVASGATIVTGTEDGRIFSSADSGRTWIQTFTGWTNYPVHSMIASGQNIFASNGQLYLSSDKGSTWITIIGSGSGLTNDISSLTTSGTNIFAGTYGGGVFLSADNGAHWTNVMSDGLNIVSLAASGSNVFAATDIGIYLSTDNAVHWTEADDKWIYQNSTALAANGNTIFAGTYENGISASEDEGRHWKEVNNGLPQHTGVKKLVISTDIFALTYKGLFFSGTNGSDWAATTQDRFLDFVFKGTDIFAGSGGGGVLLSTDYGGHWIAKNTGLTNKAVNSLAINGTHIFAGTPGGVFLSTDNADSWTAVNKGLTNKDVKLLAVSGTDIFAITYVGKVFLSLDNGSNWTPVVIGSTNQTTSLLTVEGIYLFAVTSAEGVLVSTDNGSTWTEINEGLTNPDVISLTVSGANIYAGTSGSGVWKRPLSEIAGIPSHNQSSHMEIYPNPANEKITVDYRDNSQHEILVSIFDITGKKMAFYKFENQHKMEIDVSNYAKGIYILKIQTGNETENRKLIVR